MRGTINLLLFSLLFHSSEGIAQKMVVTKAMVSLVSGNPSNPVTGTLTLSQSSYTGPVRITGMISGLSPGKHGFHVHQLGDLNNSCKAAGGHFNPFGSTHGAPTSPGQGRHAGDLGNIVASPSGTATVDILDDGISLCGKLSILGRAIVVHAGEDDLGLGGDAESLKTGNAGARVACGVIAIAEEKVTEIKIRSARPEARRRRSENAERHDFEKNVETPKE